MTEMEQLKERISELSKANDEQHLKIWKLLNEHAAEHRVNSEVLLCLASTHPNLDPVMESLLARQDELLSGVSPYLAQLYAERVKQWHTRLLYAQRVMRGPGT